MIFLREHAFAFLQTILVRCVPCSCKKTNRLHSLTFDFPSPKLRISVNSIIPTPSGRYLIKKIKRIPSENACFRKKPSPTRSSVPRWGAASFLFRNLRPFPSRRLFCIVCRHIPPSWPCIHAPHHALSWTIRSTAFLSLATPESSWGNNGICLSLVRPFRMKKIIVVHACSGQNPHCSTFVRLSRIIERPPTRVFHSCLLPSTLFNGSAASYTSSRIWMPPLHQVDLVNLCGKSAARAPFADGFLNQLLVTFFQMLLLLLAFCRSTICPINSNTHLEWCPNTSTLEIFCQRLPYPPLIFRPNPS